MSRPTKGLPFLPWYPSRFISSTRGWSVTARGIYRELIDCQWELGALPAEPAELQRMIGATSSEWKCWQQIVEAKFPIGDDGLRRNPTTEEHRAKSLGIRERNRAGAVKTNAIRWRPSLVSNGVAERSVSDQTAIAVRVAERSQSIPIPIPIHSDAYQEGELTTEVRTRGNSDAPPSGKPIQESGAIFGNSADPGFEEAFAKYRRGER